MKLDSHAAIWVMTIGIVIVLGCAMLSAGAPLLICTVPFVISYARGSILGFQESKDELERDRRNDAKGRTFDSRHRRDS